MTYIALIAVVVLLAFLIGLVREGSFNAVFGCAILGAIITFFVTVGMKLIIEGVFAFTFAFLIACVTYFIVFLLLQRLSTGILRSRGADVSKIWDKEIIFLGLFFGAAFWPLVALGILFFFRGYLQQRAFDRQLAESRSQDHALK
jgi:hypothetical protein